MKTTIAISIETRERLKKVGRKDETYDDIIRKAIDIAEKELYYDRAKRIIENEELIPFEEI